jgi:hypothetical protein
MVDVAPLGFNDELSELSIMGLGICPRLLELMKPRQLRRNVTHERGRA